MLQNNWFKILFFGLTIYLVADFGSYFRFPSAGPILWPANAVALAVFLGLKDKNVIPYVGMAYIAFFMGEILKEFPESKIIIIHRNPLQVPTRRSSVLERAAGKLPQ